MAKNDSHSSVGSKMVAGLGTAAAFAAIAGTIFVFGTKAGSKQGKKVKGWALKMKGEVLEKLENLKEVSEERYNEAIDMVSKRYQNAKKIDPEELGLIVSDMKKHWKIIKNQIDGKRKPAKKKVAKK
jgi:uncharacterized protein YpuA (DUF1002 family)